MRRPDPAFPPEFSHFHLYFWRGPDLLLLGIGTQPAANQTIIIGWLSHKTEPRATVQHTKNIIMRASRHIPVFACMPLILDVTESFALIPASQRCPSSEMNLRRHMVQSLPLSEAVGPSNYISFSADTGFLVGPNAFNAVLDRFDLRKRIAILLNTLDSKWCYIGNMLHRLNFRSFEQDCRRGGPVASLTHI